MCGLEKEKDHLLTAVCVFECVCARAHMHVYVREIHDDLSLRSLLQNCQLHLEHSGNLCKYVQGYKNICLGLFIIKRIKYNTDTERQH